MEKKYWIVCIVGILFFCLTMIGITYMTHSAIDGWGYDTTTFWTMVAIIGTIGVLCTIWYWGTFLLPKENGSEKK